MLTFCKCRALAGTHDQTLCAVRSQFMRMDSGNVKQILLAMRITAAILLIFSLHVTAKGVSQTITFSGQGVSLKTVFDEIEKQSGYLVTYNEEIISEAKLVKISWLPLINRIPGLSR